MAQQQTPVTYIDHMRDSSAHTLHDHRPINGQCAAGCPTWPCQPELAAAQRLELLAS